MNPRDQVVLLIIVLGAVFLALVVQAARRDLNADRQPRHDRDGR